MNIFKAIQNLTKKKKDVKRLSESPFSQRLTFINNEEAIKRLKLHEYKIWYIGDSDELLNFYTNASIYGFNTNIIYNRNAKNYFWSISSEEGNIKRVHSGVPNAIITTITNIVGVPRITSESKEIDKVLNDILYDNDFVNLFNQKQLPLTLVEGYGAYKINITKDKKIQIDFEEATNIDYIFEGNKIVGVIFKSYYEVDNKNYILLEIRRTDGINSYIEYKFYKLLGEDDVEEADLSLIDELKQLTNVCIKNFPYMLAVPNRIFYDVLNKNYGKSIFAGKIDLFDDLDQALGQSSQTVRVSTPVEYYDPEIIGRGKNGETKMPKVYNRQFIKLAGALPDSEGNVKENSIQTTQPILNFTQYSVEAKKILDYILTGILSPATMGIDISKRDNALAQREKEKISILTRRNVINSCEREIKQLCIILCMLYGVLNNIALFKDNEYLKSQISVKFDEFANPTFEQELETLSVAYKRGVLSTEKFVDLLYGEKVSKEEKKKEIEYIENEKAKERMSAFGLDEQDNDDAVL